jgi:hypothetical protein
MESVKLLKSKKEIMAYLRINNNGVFRRYKKEGLPIKKDGRCYCAYMPNIEAWLQEKYR